MGSRSEKRIPIANDPGIRNMAELQNETDRRKQRAANQDGQVERQNSPERQSNLNALEALFQTVRAESTVLAFTDDFLRSDNLRGILRIWWELWAKKVQANHGVLVTAGGRISNSQRYNPSFMRLLQVQAQDERYINNCSILEHTYSRNLFDQVSSGLLAIFQRLPDSELARLAETDQHGRYLRQELAKLAACFDPSVWGNLADWIDRQTHNGACADLVKSIKLNSKGFLPMQVASLEARGCGYQICFRVNRLLGLNATKPEPEIEIYFHTPISSAEEVSVHGSSLSEFTRAMLEYFSNHGIDLDDFVAQPDETRKRKSVMAADESSDSDHDALNIPELRKKWRGRRPVGDDGDLR